VLIRWNLPNRLLIASPPSSPLPPSPLNWKRPPIDGGLPSKYKVRCA